MKAAFFFAILGALARTAEGQDRFYAPVISCFDAKKQPPPKAETLRTPMLASPDARCRAYAQIDATFDETASQQCRTKAQLFVSSGKSSFKAVFEETTSEKNAFAVSLGPIAWSPNSRWLAVERAAGNYASDFGGLDLVLYDSTTGTVSTPDVLGTIEKYLARKCVLGYGSFRGFDARNRIMMRVFDWQDDNGKETHCIDGTAEWLFNPGTGAVQNTARDSPF
ncbi:MAG: hypothetical protein M3Z23_14375 [Acidobacteriota bacterium]|nr:hypothetical protein [Acidobacteriota bacterium]